VAWWCVVWAAAAAAAVGGVCAVSGGGRTVTRPPARPSIHPFIHPSIHPPTHPSTHPSSTLPPTRPPAPPPATHPARLPSRYAHASFCMSGDNTLAASMAAVEDVVAEDGDDYYVFLLSDANLSMCGALAPLPLLHYHAQFALASMQYHCYSIHRSFPGCALLRRSNRTCAHTTPTPTPTPTVTVTPDPRPPDPRQTNPPRLQVRRQPPYLSRGAAR
jgi:hypothetical protein